MRRVQGKQSSHEKTSPSYFRDSRHEQKQQHRVSDVQRQIHVMRSGGSFAEPFYVQHVRNPRQWMPVARVIRRECPHNSLPSQSGLHARILGHIVGIVVIDEARVNHRPVGKNRHPYQNCSGSERMFQKTNKRSSLRRNYCGLGRFHAEVLRT